MNRRVLNLTLRRVRIRLPKLTVRWPIIVLWAENLDGERQAGISFTWRTRNFAPVVRLRVPWVRWRTVTTPDAPQTPELTLREKLALLRFAARVALMLLVARLGWPSVVRRFAAKARGLASGVYQTAVTGRVAPEIEKGVAEWRAWRVATVYGHTFTVADIMVSLPVVAGIALSFHFAGLAWLLQTNAIQMIEQKQIILSSVSASIIGKVLGIGAFILWYNNHEKDARQRLIMVWLMLVLLGALVFLSVGQVPF